MKIIQKRTYTCIFFKKTPVLHSECIVGRLGWRYDWCESECKKDKICRWIMDVIFFFADMYLYIHLYTKKAIEYILFE